MLLTTTDAESLASKSYFKLRPRRPGRYRIISMGSKFLMMDQDGIASTVSISQATCTTPPERQATDTQVQQGEELQARSSVSPNLEDKERVREYVADCMIRHIDALGGPQYAIRWYEMARRMIPLNPQKHYAAFSKCILLTGSKPTVDKETETRKSRHTAEKAPDQILNFAWPNRHKSTAGLELTESQVMEGLNSNGRHIATRKAVAKMRAERFSYYHGNTCLCPGMLPSLVLYREKLSRKCARSALIIFVKALVYAQVCSRYVFCI